MRSLPESDIKFVVEVFYPHDVFDANISGIGDLPDSRFVSNIVAIHSHLQAANACAGNRSQISVSPEPSDSS